MNEPLNVHIYPSIFSNESRILKIVQSLKGRAIFQRIRVVAVWKEGLKTRETLADGIEVLRVAPVFGGSMPGRWGTAFKAVGWYIGVLLALRGEKIVCFNCHSLPVLPLSVLIKLWKHCVLVYDPHELETETAGLHGMRQWLARQLERILIRFANAVCVVNLSIADWYKTRYGLQTVWVVRNVPYRDDAPPARTGLLRAATGIAPNEQLFLYQGLLAPGRGVGLLLETFSRLPSNKHLVFMGYGELENQIKEAAMTHSNIHFLPAVSPQAVKDFTVDADVGLALIENVCLSYYLCLPNKLFEYTACDVPVIASAFPEMERVIKEYGCGWAVLPQVDVLHDLLRKITPTELGLRRTNAREVGLRACWQEEEQFLVTMYAILGFKSKAECAMQ